MILIQQTVFLAFGGGGGGGLSDRVQKEFDELLKGDIDQRLFVKALTHIFAVFLNTKVDTVDKIKRILKIAIKTTLKIWQDQN